MRLLPHSTPIADRNSSYREKSAPAVPQPTAPNRDGDSRGKASKKKNDAAPVAAVVPTIDYTRPTTSAELLADLQRRVGALEELSTRRLTAGEYAIAVQAMTGQSVEQWQKQGNIVEKCPCTNLHCKGWRMIPIAHHRMAADVADRDTSPVNVRKLRDVEEPNLTTVFQQMFTDGLLKKGKHDATLIPKDGPLSWSQEQQLAFAKGFEMEDLLALKGKPRELQRRLITSLREIGYDVISAPKK
jgi:hypothetical protein